MLLTQFIHQSGDQILVVNHRTEVFNKEIVAAFQAMISLAKVQPVKPDSHTAIMVPSLGIIMIPIFDQKAFVITLAEKPNGCSVKMTIGTASDREAWSQFRQYVSHGPPKVWSWCSMEGTDKDTLLKIIRHVPQIAASQLESVPGA